MMRELCILAGGVVSGTCIGVGLAKLAGWLYPQSPGSQQRTGESNSMRGRPRSREDSLRSFR